MGVIAGGALIDLVTAGFIIEDALDEHIGAASVDVRLGPELCIEERSRRMSPVDPDHTCPGLALRRLPPASEYLLRPGEFGLAHTQERLALPDWISAQFVMRSSLVRLGLDHLQAGFADAGFHGQLTLELKNLTQHHDIVIRPGMRVGQLVFHRHAPAGARSYQRRGRYTGQSGVQRSQGAG